MQSFRRRSQKQKRHVRNKSPKKAPREDHKKPRQRRGEHLKAAGKAEEKWKDKCSNRRPPKATPASWRAFESSLEIEVKWKGQVAQKGSQRRPKKPRQRRGELSETWPNKAPNSSQNLRSSIKSLQLSQILCFGALNPCNCHKFHAFEC